MVPRTPKSMFGQLSYGLGKLISVKIGELQKCIDVESILTML